MLTLLQDCWTVLPITLNGQLVVSFLDKFSLNKMRIYACGVCHQLHGGMNQVGRTYRPMVCYITFDSNSNWTFIALNLPNSKGTLRCNKTKTVNQSQCPRTEKSSSTMENTRGKTKEGMPWCKGRF